MGNGSIILNPTRKGNNSLLEKSTRKVDPTKVNIGGLEGTRFEELAKENPWLKMEYTESPWQRLVNKFGFGTDADKTIDEWTANANLYNSQLLEALGEEKYNSAQEQAERLRAAGTNPDLTGDITAGEATAIDNQSAQTTIDRGNEIAQAHEVIQKGIQVGMDAIGLITGGATTVLEGITKVLDIENKWGNRTGQIAETVNTMFDDLVDNNGKLYIPGVGTIGTTTVNKDGNGEDTLDSVTVRPTLTYDEFRRNPYIKSRFTTEREIKVAWHQFQVKINSYKPNIPAIKKDEAFFNAEGNIGKVMAYGENRQEIAKFIGDIAKAEKQVRMAVSKFQKDYYDELNKGGQTRERDENGNWIVVDNPTGGKLKAQNEKRQEWLNKRVMELETAVMKTYENVMVTFDNEMNSADTITEKAFWIYVQDKMYNHIQRSKKGANPEGLEYFNSLKDILPKTTTTLQFP